VPKTKTNSRSSRSKAASAKEPTEAQIAVHWKEEEYFHPTKEFKAQANLTDLSFVKKFSEKNFRNASTTTPISSTGTKSGRKPWTPPIRLSGNGSSPAN